MKDKHFPFDTMRAEQEEFFKKYSSDPEKKYVVAQLPTGSGKSGIAIKQCLDAGSSYLITCSKLLQDQYENDFKCWDLVSLKGKDNYECTKVAGYSCGAAPCKGKSSIAKLIKSECKAAHTCPYCNKVNQANDAGIFLTNGSLLATSLHCKTPPLRDKRKLLVFDEAHLLENFLVEACKVEINKKSMEKKFKIYKHIKPSDREWLESVEITPGRQDEKHLRYISIIHDAINKRFNELNREDDINEAISRSQMLDFLKNFTKENKNDKVDTELNTIKDQLNTYMSNLDKEWVVSYNDKTDTLTYQPVRVDWAFREIFDRIAEKFIFMSATIIDFNTYCKTLGIPASQAMFIDVDCRFDPKKSPIHCICNCKSSYKDLQDTSNLDMICRQVESILAMHPGERGIVHTGNMKVSNYIKDHARTGRLLVREGDTTNQMILEKHVASKDTVLVSSSMIEGVDLKDDLSRFQIIVKLPWLSLGDPRIKLITESNPKWYQTEMWRRLIQASGRSTRNADDSSHTYMLDSSFIWKLKSYSGQLPAHFLKRICK